MKKLAILFIVMIVSGCMQQDRISYNLTTENYDYNYEYTTLDNYVFTIDDMAQNFTLSFWFNPESAYLNTTLITLNLGDDYLMLSTSENSNTVTNGINLSTKSDKIITSLEDSNILMNQWNQIVLTKDGKRFTIYLNGIKIADDELKVKIPRNIEVLMGFTTFYNDPQFGGVWRNFVLYPTVFDDKKIVDQYLQQYAESISQDQLIVDNHKYPFLELNTSRREIEVEWTSESNLFNPELNRIERPQKDVDVLISALLKYNDQEIKRDYLVKIKGTENVEEIKTHDINILINQMGSNINDGMILPKNTNSGCEIIWSSADAIISDYKVTKQSEEEYQNIALKAQIDCSYQLTKTFDLILLDAYSGYLLSYFDGELGHEYASLLYSYDGLNWFNVDNFKLDAENGTKRVRDPFLARNKEGHFYVIATQGYDNPSIYYWETQDFISFSEDKLLTVADANFNLGLSGKRAWAPESYYDAVSDEYYIIYSDPKDNSKGMYYVTTKDFEEVSYPKTFFSAGYPVIDATIVWDNNQYIMFYKDESKAGRTIYYATFDSFQNLTYNIYDNQYLTTTRYLEGPFVLKSNVDNEYYLFADNYPNAKFLVWQFNDIEDGFKELSPDQFSLPEKVRHGSALSVTKKELDRIINYYN